jgi:hypothetical protein
VAGRGRSGLGMSELDGSLRDDEDESSEDAGSWGEWGRNGEDLNADPPLGLSFTVDRTLGDKRGESSSDVSSMTSVGDGLHTAE